MRLWRLKLIWGHKAIKRRPKMGLSNGADRVKGLHPNWVIGFRDIFGNSLTH